MLREFLERVARAIDAYGIWNVRPCSTKRTVLTFTSSARSRERTCRRRLEGIANQQMAGLGRRGPPSPIDGSFR